MKKLVIGSLTIVSIALAGATAFADPPAPPSPPQEAFDACASSKEGDACSVSFQGHSIAGTCATFPGSNKLACRPNGPPPPPPEAVKACASSKAGEACTVDMHGHSVTGTCEHGPDGNGPLACRPAGPPPHRR